MEGAHGARIGPGAGSEAGSGAARVARENDPVRTRVLHHVGDEWVDGLAATFPDVEFLRVPAEGELGGFGAEILLTTAIGGPRLDEVLDCGVRWVHTIGTGVDRFPLHMLREGQVLTCSRGASATPISEWVLAVMLAFEKQIPEVWSDVSPARWFQADLGGLHGRRLGVLGMGAIGTEVARRALAFDMDVRGLRRSTRPPDLAGVHAVATASEAVADAHHVVIAAPLTDATRHLVDGRLLAMMRPGAHVVNVARGGLVDQDALRDALDAGHIARASLDVTDPEPLPEGHWMYDHPRVRLSPHISWSMPESNGLLYKTFRTNLDRWLRDDPLEGVVDVQLGY
jgi:phosphoglycerate dehydrogenase-like enzyme